MIGSYDGEFGSWPERLRSEREQRIADGKHALSFGVDYLDRCLGGISPFDLILIGGKPGAGKSELVNLIAMSNVARGYKVHTLALEAEALEFERRLKYRLVTACYFNDANRKRSDHRINYLDWRLGRLEEELGPYDELVNSEITQHYPTGFTLYRVKDFGIREVERAVLSVQTDTDLIILDHLHYIDTDDDNENRAHHAMVKQLRDIALEIGKPVVLVAHVRKGDRKTQSLIPDLEDFHGTSNITKIATKAVMISAAMNEQSESQHHWCTYMRAAKCRMDGSRTKYLGLAAFNTRKSCYEKSFKVARYFDGMTEFESLTQDQLPHWAR